MISKPINEYQSEGKSGASSRGNGIAVDSRATSWLCLLVSALIQSMPGNTPGTEKGLLTAT